MGVRYKTPIGPLRVDFGYNLNPPYFPSLKNLVINQVNGTITGQFSPQQAGHFNFSSVLVRHFRMRSRIILPSQLVWFSPW